MTTTLNTSTLRPGLLVSLKTGIAGNVTYRTKDIEREHITSEGEQKAKWETERTTADPEEHEDAVRARTKARFAIVRVCSQSAFGLLCPESAADELAAAIREAHDVVDEFNSRAKLTRLSLYVITGRVAADDVEAVRAINSEVRDLLNEMQEGVGNLEVKRIRDAATKAKSIGAMLSPDAAARITIAVEAARGAAKKIVQAGEMAAAEVDRRAIATLKEQRTAFLDIDEQKEIAKPKQSARAVEMMPEGEVVARKRSSRSAARQLEVE